MYILLNVNSNSRMLDTLQSCCFSCGHRRAPQGAVHRLQCPTHGKRQPAWFMMTASARWRVAGQAQEIKTGWIWVWLSEKIDDETYWRIKRSRQLWVKFSMSAIVCKNWVLPLTTSLSFWANGEGSVPMLNMAQVSPILRFTEDDRGSQTCSNYS